MKFLAGFLLGFICCAGLMGYGELKRKELEELERKVDESYGEKVFRGSM